MPEQKKHRWHLTPAEIKKIKTLRLERRSQTEIARTMHITRNTVARALKTLGMLALPNLEPNILALLRKNEDRRDVAKKLHVSLNCVERVGATYRIKRKIHHDPFKGKRARVDAAIKQRSGQAIDIARENRVPYRQVLRRAHEIHGPAKFIGGKQKVAFISYFPQSQKELTNFFGRHKLSVFPFDGKPVNILGPEGALLLADVVVRTSFGGRVPDDFIQFSEKLAHSCLRFILEEQSDWWNGLSTPDKNLIGHTLSIELIEAVNTLRLMPEAMVCVN